MCLLPINSNNHDEDDDDSNCPAPYSPIQHSDMPQSITDKRWRLEKEQTPAALFAKIVAHLNFAVHDRNHQVVIPYVRTFALDQ